MKHIPITEGGCWCGVSHHCTHANQNNEDFTTEDICCVCGTVLPVQKIANEKHGPWCPWLYVAIRVEPSEDACPGHRQPASPYQRENGFPMLRQ